MQRKFKMIDISCVQSTQRPHSEKKYPKKEHAPAQFCNSKNLYATSLIIWGDFARKNTIVMSQTRRSSFKMFKCSNWAEITVFRRCGSSRTYAYMLASVFEARENEARENRGQDRGRGRRSEAKATKIWPRGRPRGQGQASRLHHWMSSKCISCGVYSRT